MQICKMTWLFSTTVDISPGNMKLIQSRESQLCESREMCLKKNAYSPRALLAHSATTIVAKIVLEMSLTMAEKYRNPKRYTMSPWS